jgi:serine/threonine protein kinase
MSQHRKKTSGDVKRKQQTQPIAAPEEEPVDATQLCRRLGLENQRASSSNFNAIRPPSKVYKLTSVIGEGTYGVVHRGVDTRNNRLVAVKQMDLDP